MPPPPAPDPEEARRALGEIVAVLLASPDHRAMALEALEPTFLAPLALGQLRIWRRGARPVAVATWGWLSAAAARAHVETGAPPGPEDWRSGDALWFVDLVAPFGDGRAVAQELRGLIIPPSGVAFGVRRRPDGAAPRVVRYTHRPLRSIVR
jgi:cytolysin-activating lysine-acyltransferase